ncbi:MAG: hypothetical protein BGN88_04795 [Clostridiales bacterium 43-6]|nr:MAG: hypothetical protein BGN88_04795 [Clostridiales bacterium 43-6]
MERVNQFLFKDVRHAWILTYYFALLWQFSYIEKRNDHITNWVSVSADGYIPYLNFFVVFYILWFLYVGVALTVFVFLEKSDFFRLTFNIFVGMTICYVIYMLYPHGQPLREALTAHETNVFNRMVYYIYSCDNPANTAPSIHVLNSIAVTVAINRSEFFRKRMGLIIGANILNVLIILSTVFIKQHSVIDIVLAFILSLFMQLIIYKVDWKSIFENARGRHQQRKIKL